MSIIKDIVSSKIIEQNKDNEGVNKETFNYNKVELEYLITTCLKLELYDEAYDYMNKLLLINSSPLSESERNLLFKTTKEKFNYLSTGWKNLLDFEQAECDNNLISKTILEKELIRFEDEIKKFCLEVISIIEKLEANITVTDDLSAYIFYKKFKADYFKHYTEVSDENEFVKYADISDDNYKLAYEKCSENFQPENAMTLSVALNYSIFVYFTLDDTRRAFNIADNVYRQAMSNLDPEKDKKTPEVEYLIKSLEENLTIWKIELDEN